MTYNEQEPEDVRVEFNTYPKQKVQSAYAVTPSGKIGSTYPFFDENGLAFTVRHPENLNNHDENKNG